MTSRKLANASQSNANDFLENNFVYLLISL